jgi:hypothetical protein
MSANVHVVVISIVCEQPVLTLNMIFGMVACPENPTNTYHTSRGEARPGATGALAQDLQLHLNVIVEFHFNKFEKLR